LKTPQEKMREIVLKIKIEKANTKAGNQQRREFKARWGIGASEL
jgi:hypothetical protein